MSDHLLWPPYAAPSDLAAIESVPLDSRGLPESTYALLSRAAVKWPDRPAVTVLPTAGRWREPRRRTFAGLLADVHRYANLLHQLGVRRGDAVALMSPNCADLIPATLAAQLAGIAAPINGGLAPARAAELLRRSGARVLICAGPDLAPQIWQTALDLAGQLDAILLLRPTAAPATPAIPPAIDGVLTGYLTDLAEREDADQFTGSMPRPADLAAFFHTGGTTGAPKLAAHTHANEVSNAWMVAAGSLLDSESVLFAALPLFHVNALVVTLLSPLFKGQQVVWAGPLGYREPELYGEYWKIVEKYQIAAMSAVPTIYAVLAGCPVDANISSLRHAIVGAAPLPPAVRAAFEAHTGVGLLQGYGLTEATCVSARNFPDFPRAESVGLRLPYQQVKVVRPGTWEEVATGETGALAISGPTVFAGYVTGREEDGHQLDGLGKLAGGWLDTGDLARVDADGFVYLTGRAKDLIIRGGHNIDPAVIEDALLSHPQVTAAGAVGRPDAHAGEVPVAYVSITAGATVTPEQLCAWAADHVAERAAAPRTVTVLEALPVTDVGKPYKLALRADATEREIADALSDLGGDIEVAAAADDGFVAVTVTIMPDNDRAAVQAIVDRYPIRWSLAVRS